MNETKKRQELLAFSDMLAVVDAEALQEDQTEDKNPPKELGDQILRRIMDFDYSAARILLTAARKVDKKVRRIIEPFYEFLRSFHSEINDALNSSEYTFKAIEVPELPDIDDFDEDDSTTLKMIINTISGFLPAITDLVSSLLSNKYSYAREVEIIVNTINDFCTAYSADLDKEGATNERFESN